MGRTVMSKAAALGSPGAAAPRGRGFLRLIVPLSVLALLAAGLLVTHVTTRAATCDTTWNGANADWTTAGDWSAGVPSSSSNACLPAGAYTVTITGESVQAGTLVISAGSMLALQIY